MILKLEETLDLLPKQKHFFFFLRQPRHFFIPWIP